MARKIRIEFPEAAYQGLKRLGTLLNQMVEFTKDEE